jgi:recyclin-1
MPVTIVPRAVGGAIISGGTAAAQGIAMLNPQRWAGSASNPTLRNGKWEDSTVFEAPDDVVNEASIEQSRSESAFNFLFFGFGLEQCAASSVYSLSQNEGNSTAPTSIKSSASSATLPQINDFDLLLSLDIALELIHTDRDALKRVETFASYPGHYGHRVRDTIEEIFILMLQALGDRHIMPGFAQYARTSLHVCSDCHPPQGN